MLSIALMKASAHLLNDKLSIIHFRDLLDFVELHFISVFSYSFESFFKCILNFTANCEMTNV